MSPADAAAYIEAWDRGLLESDAAARRALRGARAKVDAERPLDAALQRILRERVRESELVTHAIKDLDARARNDPVAFSCRIGAHLPGLDQLAGSTSAGNFAAQTAAFLGCADGIYPYVRERRLWEIWRAISRGA